MIDCPNCGQQLRPDSSNPQRMKCTNCDYILEAGAPQAPMGGQAYQPPVGAPTYQASTPVQQASFNSAPQAPMSAPAPPAPAPLPKGMAIAALVLGILALLNCWIPFFNALSVVLGVLALIFGIIGIVRASRSEAAGKGMAIAGVICSGLAIVVSIFVSVLTFFVIGVALENGDFPEEFEAIIAELDKELGDDVDLGTSATRESSASSLMSDMIYNDEASWTSLQFSIDGKSFALLESKFEDLEAETAWSIDLAEAGFPNGYIVAPGELIEGIPLSKAGMGNVEVEIDVYNPSKDQQDLKRCTLTAIWVRDYDSNLDFSIDDDTVGIGDTLEAATSSYGRPTSEYGSSTGEYRSAAYNTSDYSKRLYLVSGSSGRIDEMNLTAYVD